MSSRTDDLLDRHRVLVADTRLLPDGDRIRVLEQMLIRVQAEQAAAVRDFEVNGGLAGSGCRTVSSWARLHLRRAFSAVKLGRRARYLVDLPRVAEAFAAGEICEEHVDAFVRGLKLCGPDGVQAHEKVLVDLAREASAAELSQALAALAGVTNPDRDAEQVAALANRDLQIHRVGDLVRIGWVVEPALAEAVRTAVEYESAPSGADDGRTLRQRRSDALGEIVLRGISTFTHRDPPPAEDPIPGPAGSTGLAGIPGVGVGTVGAGSTGLDSAVVCGGGDRGAAVGPGPGPWFGAAAGARGDPPTPPGTGGGAGPPGVPPESCGPLGRPVPGITAGGRDDPAAGWAERDGEPDTDGVDVGAQPVVQRGRLRPSVGVLVDLDRLAGLPGAPAALLAHFGRIPTPTVQRLACDGAWHRIITDPVTGRPLDVGRTRRLATATQRTALATLFDGCAYPGCRVPYRFCEIHHLIGWARGGRTDVDLLVPYCWSHHHFLHEGGYTVSRVTDRRYCGGHRLEHRRPDGTVLPDPTEPRRHLLTQLELPTLR